MKRTLLIITVIAAAVMELIDTSIVNVALSHMSGNLGATLEDTSWVITSYAIANVIIIPITSFLSARLGRRRYYIGSVIFFTLFSFLCGQSTGIWSLVAFRFAQGIGGGALLSVSQAIVFELFPREKQSVASALFGVGVFMGPTIGPTLGGYITEHYSWQWIFYINIPIGVAVASVCYALLGEPKVKPVAGKVDWTGILLLAVGISSLQIVLERGETEDWFETRYIVWLAVVAVVALSLFIWWELTTEQPVVNLKVLKSKNLSIAAALTFISGVGLFSSVFLTPVFAQRLLNFTPTETGLLLLPGACIAVAGLMLSARLLQRGVSPLVMITVGMGLFALFSWQMSHLNLQAGAADITLALIWRGVGLAVVTVPLTAFAVSSLDARDIPQGAALNNMMRQLGGSSGLAMVNTYLVNRHASHRADLVSHITAANPLAVQRINAYAHYFSGRGFTTGDAHMEALKLLDITVGRQATLLSFSDAYLLVGLIFLLAIPLLFFAQQRKGKQVQVIMADH